MGLFQPEGQNQPGFSPKSLLAHDEEREKKILSNSVEVHELSAVLG